jgi:hypothetical protein
MFCGGRTGTGRQRGSLFRSTSASFVCTGTQSSSTVAGWRPRPWLYSPDKELPLTVVGHQIPRPNTFLSKDTRREAEILYLRQQLIVLKRSAPARPRLKATDRLIFVCLYRLFPSLIDASIVFQPETLLRWHRRGFRLFWRWKSRQRVGRPALSADVRSLRSADQSEEPAVGRAPYPW